jgi:DivIVA protein
MTGDGAPPLDAAGIARRQFATARKGLDANEVRRYLEQLAAQVAELQRREAEQGTRADAAEALAVSVEDLDQRQLVELLGAETARVLESAREAAADIRSKSEESAARLISEANDEAHRIRAETEASLATQRLEMLAEIEGLRREAREELERRRSEGAGIVAEMRREAERDGEALRAEAEEEGRQLVQEAQVVRERMLRDLARRRRAAREQVERLNAARERLLAAHEVVRRTVDEATAELTVALPEARLAGEAAMRRVHSEPDPTVEELDEMVDLARIAGLLDVSQPPTTPPPPAPTPDAGAAESGSLVPGGAPAPDVPAPDPRPAVGTSVWTPAPAAVGATYEGTTEAGDDEAADGDVPAAGLTDDQGFDAASDDGPIDEDLVAQRGELVVDDGATDDAVAESEDGGIGGHDAALGDETSAPEEDGSAFPDDDLPLTGEAPDTDDASGDEDDEAPDTDDASGDEDDAGWSDGDGLSVEEVEPVAVAAGSSSVDQLFARLKAETAVPVEVNGVDLEADPAELEHVTYGAAALYLRDPTVAVADADADGGSDPTAHDVEPAEDAGGAEDDADSDPDAIHQVDQVPEAAELLGRRDEILSSVESDVARRLKMVLADEQNEVLDALRRGQVPDGVDDLLPAPGAHAARYTEAAREDLAMVAELGAEVVGGEPDGTGEALAAELAQTVVDPLRERIARCIEGADAGELDELTSRLRALYREWKSRRIADAVHHFTAAAYAHGAYAAVPDGTSLCWLVDRSGAPCPDADDNALAGAVRKGEPFPTGDHCPPAHLGCRCLVVPEDRLNQTARHR